MATIDINSPDVPLSRPSSRVSVYRYDPEAAPGPNGESNIYFELPNVRFLSASYREGAEPGTARFRYAFRAPGADPFDPSRAEDVFPFDASGPLVVEQDDRLVVREYTDYDPMTEEAGFELLFDGFAQVPQLDLNGDTEVVTFEAYATPVRLWDEPLKGAMYRPGDAPDIAGSEVVTDLPAVFNPNGQSNCTREEFDLNRGTDYAHPVFLDWRIVRDPPVKDIWTLGPACRYILYTGNLDQKYVNNPPAGDLEILLENYQPVDAEWVGPIDPDNPDTYTTQPIEVQHLDISGDKVPVALEKVVAPHGFMFRFDLTKTGNGDPLWTIVFYRKDTQYPSKSVYLQKASPGTAVDPSQSNVASLTLSRDGMVMNSWRALTAPTQYECSMILYPLFAIDAADAQDANLMKWQEGSPNFDPVKYRHFGIDETGEGHWDFGTSATVKTTPRLGDLFGVPKPGEAPTFVNRRRPGSAELISWNGQKEARRTELYISADYKFPELDERNVVWDGSGTWQKASGGWTLLKDRCGIRITSDNPTRWQIGLTGNAGDVYGSDVNVVRCMANPDPAGVGSQRFTMRLVTRVEGDFGVNASAKRRAASPTRFEVVQVQDYRDRFVKKIVDASSQYLYPPNPGDPPERDDTRECREDLEQRRRAHELLKIAGTVTIRRLTHSYRIGDRIKKVVGREIDLRQNSAQEAGEANTYPVVVGLTYTADPEQSVSLVLDDRRSDPPPERRRNDAAQERHAQI